MSFLGSGNVATSASSKLRQLFPSYGGESDGSNDTGSDIMLHGVLRFSRDRPRFVDTLDVIKFLCKDMWTLLFRKQIDNLKTNHRV